MRSSRAFFAAALSCLALCVCASDDPIKSVGEGGAGAGEGGSGGGEISGAAPGCTEPTPVPCEDDVFLQMSLKSDVAPGVLETEPDGPGFRSLIDATAGGSSPTDSYVYGRFTDSGLVKVELSDEEALESMDWDIAFRRYVIRINSGHSGPSCVLGARIPGSQGYDDITATPADLTFRSDSYFSESCDLIPDGTGLPGAPATVLSSFWSYRSCLKMTGNVFVLALADGRKIKLTVTHYYDPESQEECNATDTLPGRYEAAKIQVRYAFLP